MPAGPIADRAAPLAVTILRRCRVPPLRWQAASGGVFAIASLLTPFFLGTVVRAVVTGQGAVTAGDSANVTA